MPNGTPHGRRRRFLRELYLRLRTEAGTPGRQGAAVGLGVFIGCLPIWGLHLPLCLLTARLARLNRLTTYLGAHVSNPLTIGPLLFLQYAVGRTIAGGRGPLPTVAEVETVRWTTIGLDLLIGIPLVGLGLGLLFGALAYHLARPWRLDPARKAWLERAAARYLESGISHWEFVRAKLRHDPLYFGLIDAGLLANHGPVVDLGCGRGILLSVLAAAEDPDERRLIGVDGSRSAVRVAAAALGDRAEVACVDLRGFEPPPCRTALLLDVLHYLGAADQERLLARLARSIEPGGRLVIREPDREPPARFVATRVAERVRAWMRGAWRQRFHYRRSDEWAGILRGLGLEVDRFPLSAGTPFSNVVLAARRKGPVGREQGELASAGHER